MKRPVLLLLAAFSLAAAVGCGFSGQPIINSVSPQPILQVLRNAETIFFVDAEDPGKEPLSYQWAASAGSPVSGSGSSFRWTTPDQACSCTVSVIVSNGKQHISQTWEISVVEVLANITTISGVVQGSLADTRIRGAKVAAKSGAVEFSTTTDFDGAYSLQVPVGSYEMRVEMQTFNTAAATVDAGSSSPVTQDFALGTGTCGTIPWPLGACNINGRTIPVSMEYRSFTRSAPAGFQCIGHINKSFTQPENCAAEGIRVYRSAVAAGPYTLIGIAQVNQYSSQGVMFVDEDPSFAPGQNLYYVLSAWNASGESSLNAMQNVVFLPELTLIAPSNGASISALSSPVFSWNALTGITTDYTIRLEKWNGSLWYYTWSYTARDVSEITYTGPALAAGTYRWCIEAQSAAGRHMSNSHYRQLIVSP